jgi:hypothetical protein
MVERHHDWENDPDAPPTQDELKESERLRRELEDKHSTHPDAELARALHLAVNPRPLDQLSHRRILDRSVPKRFPVVLVSFAAAAAALIAAISLTSGKAEPPRAALVQPHTTQALFAEPFKREGDTSKRVDAIVASRGRDLRANRYARWGVK